MKSSKALNYRTSNYLILSQEHSHFFLGKLVRHQSLHISGTTNNPSTLLLYFLQLAINNLELLKKIRFFDVLGWLIKQTFDKCRQSILLAFDNISHSVFWKSIILASVFQDSMISESIFWGTTRYLTVIILQYLTVCSKIVFLFTFVFILLNKV